MTRVSGKRNKTRCEEFHLPFDALEEGVCFDVLDPVLPVPQPVLRVPLEQNSQQTLSLRRQELRHTQLSPGGRERGDGWREEMDGERRRDGERRWMEREGGME